ncbi:CPBP family intramembrane glutamic endopeptidase [Tenggerimyces flavus]|uniref:CPBP family intramembrane glutamic endopeptidase n=1 Tax=Tenggerimyces flavus TaxID=1708749 RepID=A0ABV7Y9Y9_9ACTN|nr:CPBP family intramembrane glutamic endopeptidase [Tenggerimyces flavus]MBM7788990.1 hypothetical protein [Tenggerimyces flavus]
MESTRTPLTTAADTRPNGLAGRLLADRHSLPLSIALHLLPGIPIVGVYLLFAQPLMRALELPSFLGWAISMVVALAPIQLGLLVWLGYRRNGRLSLRGVVNYLDKPTPRGRLVLIVTVLIVQFLGLSTALVTLDNAVYEAFFSWVPFDGSGGGGLTYIGGFPQSVMVITLAVCIPLTGFSLPLIEELYFRGFLLSRLPQLGGWAPLVNTALFSIYHFWSPWAILSRIIFAFAGFWLAWKKQDLRLSIGMHVGSAFILQTLGTVALLLNVMPT